MGEAYLNKARLESCLEGLTRSTSSSSCTRRRSWSCGPRSPTHPWSSPWTTAAAWTWAAASARCVPSTRRWPTAVVPRACIRSGVRQAGKHSDDLRCAKTELSEMTRNISRSQAETRVSKAEGEPGGRQSQQGAVWGEGPQGRQRQAGRAGARPAVAKQNMVWQLRGLQELMNMFGLHRNRMQELQGDIQLGQPGCADQSGWGLPFRGSTSCRRHGAPSVRPQDMRWVTVSCGLPTVPQSTRLL